MPSKRSKSKEREKKRKARLKMSEEAKSKEVEKARIGMEKVRANRSVAQAGFDKIDKKHKMREKRKTRSGKEHLMQNLLAKKGMQMLETEGRIVKFSRRSGGKPSETRDWENFLKRNKEFKHELETRKPDIVTILNEKAREEKEKERAREERVKEDGGEWLHDGENGYFWSGEGEPHFENDSFVDEGLTKERIEELRKEEEEEDAASKKQKKEEQNEKRRLKEEIRKEAMKIPLDPLPERDLVPYEKYRENNIKEREKAMFESGFFDDLISYKKEIGLVKKSTESKKMKKIEESQWVENEDQSSNDGD